MENQFVTIAAFENALEAEISRGRLAAEEIEARLLDSNTVSVNWGLSNAIGGVKLAVRQTDVARAKSILALDHSINELDSGWGSCPSCGSKQLQVKTDRRFSSWVWLLLGIPLLFPKAVYFCKSCGQKTSKPK